MKITGRWAWYIGVHRGVGRACVLAHKGGGAVEVHIPPCPRVTGRVLADRGHELSERSSPQHHGCASRYLRHHPRIRQGSASCNSGTSSAPSLFHDGDRRHDRQSRGDVATPGRQRATDGRFLNPDLDDVGTGRLRHVARGLFLRMMFVFPANPLVLGLGGRPGHSDTRSSITKWNERIDQRPAPVGVGQSRRDHVELAGRKRRDHPVALLLD